MKYSRTFLSLSLAILLQSPLSASPRERLNFNSDWLVKVGDEQDAQAVDFSDSSWKKVTLPYAWNEDDAFRKSIDKLSTGAAWYRKHFTLPKDASGKKVFLEFEGIRHGGEFFLNGESIGLSENGIMASGFDITEKLKPYPEKNVIAARISNAWDYRERETNQRYQWNDRNFYANYGGINKNVFLHITDKLHQTLPLYSNLGTTGVYIYAEDFDFDAKSAKITAETQVKNDSDKPQTFSYEVSINELDGKSLKTFSGPEATTTLAPGETKILSASETLSGLNFWSWGYGYLYDVTTTLKVDGQPVDSVTTRTGFRKLEFGNGLVKLNDRILQLKGYAQRSTNEWPAVGSAVPPWMSDFSNGLMVASNGNLVRWMHVTPSKQDVESCDRVGLLQALPAGDSEADKTGRRWEHRVDVMRDATIYNRNNPSVVMYESGNAGISEEHMAEMKAIRDKYDPHGGRAAGSREMLDSKTAEWGGEMLYINKSARIPFWATEYSRDEGLRKYWDEWTPPYHKEGDGPLYRDKPAPSYNHNQDQHAIEDIARWYDYWRERPGTGKRVSSGGVNIVFSDTNTHHRGEANYRTSGEVDAMRIPKEGFYAHQIMWDGWVNPAENAVHLMGHWNYDAGTKKPIYAVSAADKVELFVNGQSKGFGKQSDRFLYTWEEVAFEPGEIKAIAYDNAGKKLAETAIKTAGKPVALRLTPHAAPGGLKADGADMALVDIEVIDAEGNRCPTAMNLVKFDLEGPAEWRGGIAVAPDNGILAKELPVEVGINRVILRSQPQAGKIILKATAEGLKSATLELESAPFPVEGGLSKTLPDVGLKPHFYRGPTPTENTAPPTRTPIAIVSATAGANADKVGQAFDDNEKSGWSNDNKLEDGWIQFDLERPAKVNEIVMKLSDWRNKSYPLRVWIDNKKVWEGSTEKSLGYVHLTFEATQGNKVRIALRGAVEDSDAFNDIVEVTGKKLNDSDEGKGGSKKNRLAIREIEVYEPLPDTP
ncbi:MAG: DUF4982 domain-containing protein [Chthoniobacterales bacterium]